MAKVYLMCGKICSGKSYYAKKLQKKVNAVILSPDEMTYILINNEQGELYDRLNGRVKEYLNKKSVEIVRAGANVIYDRGLWSRWERDSIREYYKKNNIEFEIHYIDVSDKKWNKQIEKRNKLVESGKGGSNFYFDENLKNKLLSEFEEPSREEVDVWIENK